MLDHVDRPQPVERPVRKRIRKAVKIADHIRRARRIDADTNGTRIFPNSAADIQRFHFFKCERRGIRLTASNRYIYPAKATSATAGRQTRLRSSRSHIPSCWAKS